MKNEKDNSSLEILKKANVLDDETVIISTKKPLDPDVIRLDSGSYIDECLTFQIVFYPHEVYYRNPKSNRLKPIYMGMENTELFPYIFLVDSEGNKKFLTLQMKQDIFEHVYSDTREIVPDESGITKKLKVKNHPIIQKKFFIPKELYNRSNIRTSPDIKTLDFFNNDGFNYSPKKLFEDFKVEFQTYIDTDSWINTSLTLWTLGSYFFQIFDAYPYLLLHKVKGSGKTRTLKTIESLSRDGMLLHNTSLSSMFRMADTYHPTMCLDQLEKLKEKDQLEFISALCSGYDKGAVVYRSESLNNNWIPRAFNIYCPKALASIHAIDTALEDRCLHIPIKRSMKIKEFKRSPNIDDLKPLRDLAYKFALYEGMKICYKYNNDKFELPDKLIPDTNPRLAQILTPILIMAELFELDKDELEFENICKIIECENNISIFESLNEFDTKLLVAIKRLIGEKETVWVSNKEIVYEMDPTENQKKYYERVIGKRMKKWLEFTAKKICGKARYSIKCDVIDDLIERYHIQIDQEGLKDDVSRQQQF